MKTTYVISIKAIRDYYGKPLSGEEQHWEYAQIDTGSSINSGYPVFRSDPVEFSSLEEAKAWYNFAEPYLKSNSNLKNYDWSTLAIRQRIVTYEVIEKLG